MAALKLDQARPLLRAITLFSAVCGVLTNAITITQIRQVDGWKAPNELNYWAFLPLLLSILWNSVDGTIIDTTRHRFTHKAWAMVDILGFLAFVALMVGNGVIATDLDNVEDRTDMILLLAYNSFPWMLCADMHIAIALLTLLRGVHSGSWPRISVVWPERDGEAEREGLIAHEEQGGGRRGVIRLSDEE